MAFAKIEVVGEKKQRLLMGVKHLGRVSIT